MASDIFWSMKLIVHSRDFSRINIQPNVNQRISNCAATRRRGKTRQTNMCMGSYNMHSPFCYLGLGCVKSEYIITMLDRLSKFDKILKTIENVGIIGVVKSSRKIGPPAPRRCESHYFSVIQDPLHTIATRLIVSMLQFAVIAQRTAGFPLIGNALVAVLDLAEAGDPERCTGGRVVRGGVAEGGLEAGRHDLPLNCLLLHLLFASWPRKQLLHVDALLVLEKNYNMT